MQSNRLVKKVCCGFSFQFSVIFFLEKILFWGAYIIYNYNYIYIRGLEWIFF